MQVIVSGLIQDIVSGLYVVRSLGGDALHE